MLTLREKTHEEIAVWLPAMKSHYVDERVAAGQPREDATRDADRQFEELLPGGVPAEGQHVMTVLQDGEAVGQLWMGRPLRGEAEMWFVFFVEVDEAHRGRGLGRAIMQLAEGWVAERGGTKIGLNVFGPNVVARRLYDSLGYDVLATSMVKELAKG